MRRAPVVTSMLVAALVPTSPSPAHAAATARVTHCEPLLVASEPQAVCRVVGEGFDPGTIGTASMAGVYSGGPVNAEGRFVARYLLAPFSICNAHVEVTVLGYVDGALRELHQTLPVPPCEVELARTGPDVAPLAALLLLAALLTRRGAPD